MFEDIISQYVCPRCGQKLIAKEVMEFVSNPFCADPCVLVDQIGCGCAEPWYGISVRFCSSMKDSEITAKLACEYYIDNIYEMMEKDKDEEEEE